jgi:hypothetical protein
MFIMLLNDESTWTSLEGCRIIELEDYLNNEDVEEALRVGDFAVVTTFSK